ncbi:hypothetical protein FCM35_KLT05532 [Carex littledalei]|uniref:Uncharacterized protein n=1 Tax=Carex littledalei TaxID=544730 RepID=A0A833R5C4_9POAL|nr:hypothetical protein FCM35_KLT05532 [Carex littledalei]
MSTQAPTTIHAPTHQLSNLALAPTVQQVHFWHLPLTIAMEMKSQFSIHKKEN